MEMDVPSDGPNDEWSNQWGARLQQLEDEIEIAQKNRKLINEYREREYLLDAANTIIFNAFRNAGMKYGEDYEIEDVEIWHSNRYRDYKEAMVNVNIGKEELDFIIGSDLESVQLYDYDGNIDMGLIDKQWENDELFEDKLKEYLALEPHELEEWLNNNRA
jgi:hypothetical protein